MGTAADHQRLFSGSQGIAAIFLPETGRVCEKSVWSAKGNYQFIRPHGGRKRGIYGIFYFSDHDLTDISGSPWRGPCSMGRHQPFRGLRE